MIDGDTFEDKVPTEDLQIKDALLILRYPRVDSCGWAPKVDTIIMFDAQF